MSKWHWNADEFFGKQLTVYPPKAKGNINDKSLLMICLELHQNATGSADYLNAEQYGQYYHYIANRIKNWKPPLMSSRRFDNAVRELAKATIEECDRFDEAANGKA